MSRRIVHTAHRDYLFCPDDSPPVASRLWRLVRLDLVDELTGGPPTGAVTISAEEKRMIPRVSDDGVAGLIGVPLQVFPGLKATPYTVHVTVKAEGYVPREVLVPVSPDVLFPDSFTPPLPMTVFLHREPTVVVGRAVRPNGLATLPVSGATVKVTGIWRTPPPANAVVPPDAPNLVSLGQPVYSLRQGGVGQLKRGNLLPPIAGDDKFLLEAVPPGAVSVRLSNRLNLNTGDVLQINGTQPDISELLAISSITGASTPDQPARVTFDYPTANGHSKGALVQRTNPQPLGPAKQISVDAEPGDTCVFLNNVTGLGTANEVLVTGGGTADEFHGMKLFSVTSDADGYYRLPPLSRVAQLEITASKTIGPQNFTAKVEFRPDYKRRENRLDLTLTV